MRNVVWISEFIRDTHWVEEPDCLVSRRSHTQLCFLEIADVNDGGIMSLESFEDRDVPGWTRLEKLHEISLDVPNDDLGLEGTGSFACGVALVG